MPVVHAGRPELVARGQCGAMRLLHFAAAPLTLKRQAGKRLGPHPSKIVKLLDVSIDDQPICSRSSGSPADVPVIVDGHLSLSSRL